ncbi:hypothetical protein COLO4_13143 [Corchorus olitorius]|uniref:Uncharacterized protein n=1 Tax=Corchorus olitorius TaxID=93759 RepID=A0A1R3JXT6_9ROSI|nr:hypothetical protein COLO4_13143 [Corchorus olitorius]
MDSMNPSNRLKITTKVMKKIIMKDTLFFKLNGWIVNWMSVNSIIGFKQKPILKVQTNS